MRRLGLLFINQLWMDLKLHLRQRVAVFWEFLFPVVMMLLFAVAFGGDQSGISIELGLVDLDRSELSVAMVEAFREVPIFQLEEAANEEDLRAKLEAGKLDGLAIIPSGFQASLGRSGAKLPLAIYGGSNPQLREVLISAVQRLVTAFNEHVRRSPSPRKWLPQALKRKSMIWRRSAMSISSSPGFWLRPSWPRH